MDEQPSLAGAKAARKGIQFSVLALGPDYRGYAPHWSWLLRCLSEVSLAQFPKQVLELMLFFTQDGIELRETGNRKKKYRAFLHKDGQLVVSVLLTDPEYDVDEEDFRGVMSEMVKTSAELAVKKCGKDLSPEAGEAFLRHVALGLEKYNNLELPLRFPKSLTQAFTGEAKA